MLPSSCSSWLCRQSAPPHVNISCCGNVQIVPRIHCSASSNVTSSDENYVRQSQQQRGASVTAATTAAAVPTPTVPLPIDHEDPDPTKARLHALYRFVIDKKRLPEVHEQQEGIAVGHWAEQCRQMHQNQELDAELAAALESIRGWDWEPQLKSLAARFDEAIRAVQRYQQQSSGKLPRTRVFKAYVGDYSSLEQKATSACRQLAEWRKRGVLTRQQIHHVVQALPGWAWDERIRAPPFDEVIQVLQNFLKETGRLPRQTDRSPDGFLLGDWCTLMRSEYAQGRLEPDVADALAQAVPGWSWSLTDTAFEINLDALKAFVSENGRIPAQRETHGGVRIGAWCNKRRLQYKQGKMTADRVAALEAVPGWWWTADDMPAEP